MERLPLSEELRSCEGLLCFTHTSHTGRKHIHPKSKKSWLVRQLSPDQFGQFLVKVDGLLFLTTSFFYFWSDASRLLPPAGSGSLQEAVCVLSRGPSADHAPAGPLPGLLSAPGLQAPAVGCHHHPGLHQRHDRSPTLQEAKRRGRNLPTSTSLF